MHRTRHRRPHVEDMEETYGHKPDGIDYWKTEGFEHSLDKSYWSNNLPKTPSQNCVNVSKKTTL